MDQKTLLKISHLYNYEVNIYELNKTNIYQLNKTTNINDLNKFKKI